MSFTSNMKGAGSGQQPNHKNGVNRNNGNTAGGTASKRSHANPTLHGPQALPNSPETSTLSSGKGGGSLRAIDQTFQVNPNSGTLSLSIPLQVTTARNDFHPKLSLGYDSGSGNGPFGMGWGVSLPCVVRKSSKEIPRYDETDTFLLSGLDDLVSCPTSYTIPDVSAFTVRSFRARTQGAGHAERIELWTSKENSDDMHWKTISSENVVRIYGRDDASRIFERLPSGYRKTYSWLLCESYDPCGNAMLYTYKPENDDGIAIGSDDVLPPHEQHRGTVERACNRYIKSIKYGNRVPSRDVDSWNIVHPGSGMQWTFELVFDYGEHSLELPETQETYKWATRRDICSTRVSGFEIRTYRLCRRILMFHHIPEKLTLRDYLVASYNFGYKESDHGSFLTAIVLNGHAWDAGKNPPAYETQSLPARMYEYTVKPECETLQVQSITPAAFQMLPGSIATNQTQWIDLYGEGAQGILLQSDGSWCFQRNELGINAALDPDDLTDSIIDDFGPITTVAAHPSTRLNPSMSYFEDIDGNGTQDVVIVNDDGRIQGYFEVDDEGQWSQLHEFESAINIDLKSKPPCRIDLTGTGLADVVVSGDRISDSLWFECIGAAGFAAARHLTGPENFPKLRTDDPKVASFIADATGDGLLDVIQVSNGRVSYWPNLGHGKFGKEVVMDASPIFDADDVFHTARLHLLDLDGSGTADMIYLLPAGGAVVYHNHCGNSWSRGVLMGSIPRIDDLSSVFVMDLLGKGTSTLCWTVAQGTNASFECSISYVDFGGTTKPNLLASTSHGSGLKTTINYRPSTKFYLQDERQGKPWKTRLPFPVHTVYRTVEEDLIMSTKRTVRYGYHDGYYDGREREFCGFGLVDQWETEEFILAAKRKPYQKPTRHTRMWYHTGALKVGEFLTDSAAWSPSTVRSKIPATMEMTAGERIDACRALKGSILRSEVYENDKSTLSSIPYYVEEYSYDVALLSRYKSKSQPATFRTSPRETASQIFERQEDEPRITRDLVLATNDHGDPVKAVTVQYGRTGDGIDVDKQTLAAQKVHHATFKEFMYTNDIDDDDNFYKSAVCSEMKWHVATSAHASLFGIESLRHSGLDAFQYRHLGKVRRTYYRSSDFSKRLDLGKRESFSVVDRHYDLAMTDTMATSLYGNKDDGSSFSTSALQQFSEHGGYEDLDQEGSMWVPSHSLLYAPAEATHKQRLRSARCHFFVPIGSQDSFNNVTLMEMDDFDLLPNVSKDAMGNITRSENDYRVMQVWRSTDANGNQTESLFDALGQKTAIAVMGKPGERAGDSLRSTKATVSSSELIAFVQSPNRSVADKLLGDAGSRSFHIHEAIPNLEKSGATLTPSFRLMLQRTEHVVHQGDEAATQGDVIVEVDMMNGRCEVYKKLLLQSWNSAEQTWSASTHEVLDSAGNLIVSVPAYFTAGAFSQLDTEIPVIRTVHFLDALDRHVGTLHANHSFEKTVISSWSTTEYDAGDLIDVIDPREDADLGFHFALLNPDMFIPSWRNRNDVSESPRERRAAQLSQTCANRPLHLFPDSRTNIVSTVEVLKDRKRISRNVYDEVGNLSAEIDGMGRVVQRYSYDLLKRVVEVNNMDSGRRLTLLDSAGKALADRDDRGAQRRWVSDSLRRNIQTHVIDSSSRIEVLWSKVVYGEILYAEKEGDPRTKNLRNQVAMVCDQAGVRRFVEYDFKGNSTATENRLVKAYKTTVDWAGVVDLEDELFTSAAIHDALNRPTETADALGLISIRSFDTSGQLRTIVSCQKSSPENVVPHISQTTYTADALPSRIDYGNKTHTDITYDPSTRQVIRRTTSRDDGAVLEDVSTTYDILGRVVDQVDDALQTTFFRNCRIQPCKTYEYDDLGHLAKATGRESINSRGNVGRSLSQTSPSNPLARGFEAAEGSALCAYEETYLYDDADNMLSMRHVMSDASISGWTRKYTYNEPSLIDPSVVGNRLTSTSIGNTTDLFQYGGLDGRVGCTTSMSGLTSLTWDANQKLRSSARQRVSTGDPETVWYIYDSSGNRVRKVVESAALTPGGGRIRTETIFLGSAEVFREYSPSGADLVKTISTSLIMAAEAQRDKPLCTIEEHLVSVPKSRTISGRLARHHVSPELELDDEGQVVSHEEYTPFGVSVTLNCRSDVDPPQRYRYAAYQRDQETGLYACGARYYMPWLGRWISPDPIGTDDGPNVYAYVGNDPINFVDPRGTKGKNSVTPVGERGHGGQRGGQLDLKDTLKSAKDILWYKKALEQEFKRSRTPLEKVQDHFKQNGKSYMRKAANILIAEAIGLIPVAGEALKLGVGQVFKQIEKSEEIKQRLKEDTQLIEVGVEWGRRFERQDMGKELQDILGKDHQSLDDKLTEVRQYMLGYEKPGEVIKREGSGIRYALGQMAKQSKEEELAEKENAQSEVGKDNVVEYGDIEVTDLIHG